MVIDVATYVIYTKIGEFKKYNYVECVFRFFEIINFITHLFSVIFCHLSSFMSLLANKS